MKTNFSTLVAATLLFATSGSVYAQQAPQPQGWSWGVGAVIQQLGYRGGDTEVSAFPLVSYEGEKLYWRGPELGYRVSENFTVIGNYRFDGYEADDSEFLAGMEDRKGTLELGAAFTFDVAGGQLTASGTADVLSEHEGYQLNLGYSQNFRALGGLISPFVQVSYLSEDLVDYYYGVELSEATALRTAYDAENTMNFTLGASGMWSLTESQTLITNLSYSRFGSEISDSSIVDDSGAVNLLVVWAHSF